MLLSEVMADNIGSVRMLKKAGYREVGRIPRRLWKRGEYRDVVILVLERE
jgi:RimJ/RimL family protein N-acetyltransferase